MKQNYPFQISNSTHFQKFISLHDTELYQSRFPIKISNYTRLSRSRRYQGKMAYSFGYRSVCPNSLAA